MRPYDIIGVGIGPSNLSTAALLWPLRSSVNSIFFDDKKEFSWHPGLMFPYARLQVSILKDLVTMLDPTSAFSFLNYLKERRELYIFAARNGFNKVTRREFELYFKWVASKLENLSFNSAVDSISYKDELFTVVVNDKHYETRNIIIGAGLTSNIPSYCQPFLSSSLFHSSQFLKQYNNYNNKSVAIIGGGQSSCEILKFILSQEEKLLPSCINWIFRDHKLNILEDTPFANELFTPNYSEYVFSLEDQKRAKLIEQEKFTSDGVSESTLFEIYELLYYTKFNTKCNIRIYNDSTLTGLSKTNDTYCLSLKSSIVEDVNAEIVILGTGFHYKIPACLESLSKEYHTDNGMFQIDKTFSLKPKSDIKGNIFIHNGAKHIRGLADPNLSLIAWRSGVIINCLLGKEIYNVENEKSIINWSNP